METFKIILGGIITVVIVVGLVVPTVLHIVTTLKECRELRSQIDEERERRENNLRKKVKGRNYRPQRFENNFENSSRK